MKLSTERALNKTINLLLDEEKKRRNNAEQEMRNVWQKYYNIDPESMHRWMQAVIQKQQFLKAEYYEMQWKYNIKASEG